MTRRQLGRRVALACGGLLAAAAVAAGGANPQSPGLPGQWSGSPWETTVDRGYRAAPSAGRPVIGNGISAMCVECHRASPSLAIPGPAGLPSGDTEPMYRGSHFVWNQWDGADHPTNPVRAADWEKLTAWSSGAFSKYGVAAGNTSLIQATGEQLCESCHNVLRNLGDQLLVEVYDTGTGTATLCDACHADITGATHHPMAGADTTDDASVRNPPYDPAKTGGVAYYTSPPVSCLSCHRVHDAQTATGARALRRGASQVKAGVIAGVFEKPVNVVYYADNPDAGSVPGTVTQRSSNGIHRQSDMASGKFLAANRDPLCDACHKYND